MRNFLLLFLSILIVFSSIWIRPFESFAAAAPIIRIAAGSTAEKIMFGIAEKAGVKYANKSAMDKARERWNMELYESLKEQTTPIELKQRLDDFTTALNKAEVIPLPDKKGYGKVILNTVLFLTGLDIILEAYNIFKDAHEQNKYADGFKEKINNGDYVKYWPGYQLRIVDTGTSLYGSWTHYEMVNSYGRTLPVLGGYGHVDREPFDWYYEIYIEHIDRYRIGLKYNNFDPEKGRIIGSKGAYYVYKSQLPSEPFITTFPLRELDIPDITNIPKPIAPLASPGLEPSFDIGNLPETIEIIIPINEPYPEPGGEPLNTPDDLFNLNPNPEPEPTPSPEPEPTPSPEPEPTPSPEPEPNPIPEPPPASGLDLTPLIQEISRLKEKFPFSIPWDIYHLISFLNVPPKAPKFTVDVKNDVNLFGNKIPVHYKFDLDFTGFDWIAKIFRWGLIIIFDISLIFALRRFTPD